MGRGGWQHEWPPHIDSFAALQRFNTLLAGIQRLLVRLDKAKDLYTSRILKRATRVVADPSYPGHRVFESLPSGRRLWNIRTKTSCHKNSFFPSATDLINNTKDPLSLLTCFHTD
ncbi:hypothetical protein HF521_021631 [Silurus meridionalis]|uniref:Uncharacterized protein n=1 Tax=Silurus meridionalis TaxID=175797 RepID=A0A8T0BCA4_SILME|nr:hypothetical protein HF521_021631 [Silurus meridionalis]